MEYIKFLPHAFRFRFDNKLHCAKLNYKILFLHFNGFIISKQQQQHYHHIYIFWWACVRVFATSSDHRSRAISLVRAKFSIWMEKFSLCESLHKRISNEQEKFVHNFWGGALQMRKLEFYRSSKYIFRNVVCVRAMMRKIHFFPFKIEWKHKLGEISLLFSMRNHVEHAAAPSSYINSKTDI